MIDRAKGRGRRRVRAGLGAAVIAAAGLACSSGGGPKATTLAIVQAPVTLVEEVPAGFTIEAQDATGHRARYRGAIAIDGVGPVEPAAAVMSADTLALTVTLQLGGENHVTFSAAGLAPATYSLAVEPAVPGRVAAAAGLGAVLGTGGGWDAAGAWAPSAVFAGGAWRLYYASSSATAAPAIGLATSPDGVAFTRSGTAPVVGPGAAASSCHASGASAPDVFAAPGGGWEMLYVGSSGAGRQLCRATSTDGLVWTPVGAVLAPSSGTATFDDSAITAVSAFAMSNGTLAALYTGEGVVGTAQVLGLGRATSPDGATWTRAMGANADGSIASRPAAGPDDFEWEAFGIGAASVERAGPVLRVWAGGFGTGGVWRIGRYATLDFTQLGPILECGVSGAGCGANGADELISAATPGAFDEDGALQPSVARGADGWRRVYYTGIGADGVRRIGLVEY